MSSYHSKKFARAVCRSSVQFQSCFSFAGPGRWLTTLFLFVGLILFSGAARAVDFYGSDPLGSAGLTVAPGIDLLNTDEFSVNQIFANPGTDSFVTVPYFTTAGPVSWMIDLTDLSNLSFGSTDFGTFTGNAGGITSRSASFVNGYVSGSFDNTMASGVPYVDQTSPSGNLANLHFALTQTGQAISWSGTLMVTDSPSLVPEPASGLSAALGLLGVILCWWRVRKRR